MDEDRAISAVHAMGRFAYALDYRELPAPVQDRCLLMLTDLVGVTAAGARTPELAALLGAWAPSPGAAAVIGAGRSADLDAAVVLNGTAACCLELDEGNKYARGHPAAHVVFAALGAAQSSVVPVSGVELLSAVVAGYEVAARFGSALRPRPETHPHGHWGATGAGAAVARVTGLPAEGIAAAIDAAAGLVLATPWSVVLAGSFVRNLWVGAANVSGLHGARLAAAGLSVADGTVLRTLGSAIGSLDLCALVGGLGERWYLAGGYFKRHSCCSYTHPAADMLLRLREQYGLTPGQVESVLVQTHRLSMPLARLASASRVAAMFSLPYVAAVALADGQVGPAQFSAERRADPALAEAAGRVEVREDSTLTARLPDERANRVTVSLSDGRMLRAEQPNPIGDADYLPLDADQVRGKLDTLLGARTAGAIADLVRRLPGAADARVVLDDLP